ncbi:DUF4142 domain-containing protein [Sorangium sp. So ce513]|uniref:DUF4142 domain-containing protein n=1 Tax=Sorangium sp. So ce513 TaxID=3133315 RepID=UPI003F5E4A36
MLRNRSGRLAAIMFAGSFALAGAGGCIAGAADEVDTDGESTAGGESNARENRGADGRRGGQTGGDRARRTGGGQSGGEQAGFQGDRRGEQGDRRSGQEQACGDHAGFQGDRQGGNRQPGGHSAMRQPSEQELATLISLINQQEIEQSKIARQKSDSPEVQRFAEQMIDEHSRAEQHGAELSRGARVSLAACPQCGQFQASAVETRESLQEQEGAEFDVTFIWAQISLHRRALEVIDEQLVERMKDASLRSHLIKLRSDLERHLSSAEEIFCSLQQQQSGQQKGAQQQGPQSAQQQGPQSAQQQGPQSAQQQGPQSAQQQGPQSAQQQGPQSAQQQGQQQRGQLQGQQRGYQHGPQSTQQVGQQRGGQLQGQQRGYQHGPQSTQQVGQQRGGQMQGQQSAQQQGSGQRGSQSYTL